MLSGKRDTAAAMAREIREIDQSLESDRAYRAEQLNRGSKLEQERATLAAKQSASAGTEARLRELHQRNLELRARNQQLKADDRAADAKAAARRRELEQAKATSQATLAQSEAITAAGAERDAVQMALGRRQSELADRQRDLAEVESLATRHAALASELRGMEQRGSVAAQLARTLKAQTDVMDTVPCGGHSMHSQCPLLAQARDAKGQYEAQAVVVTKLRTTYREKQDALTPMEASLKRLPAAREAVAALQRHIARDNQELQRLTAWRPSGHCLTPLRLPLKGSGRSGCAGAGGDRMERPVRPGPSGRRIPAGCGAAGSRDARRHRRDRVDC